MVLLISGFIYSEINGRITLMPHSILRVILLHLSLVGYIWSNLCLFKGTWQMKVFVMILSIFSRMVSEGIVWSTIVFILGTEGAAALLQTAWPSGEIGNYVTLLLILLIRKSKLHRIQYFSKKTMVMHGSIIISSMLLSIRLLIATDFFYVFIFTVQLFLFYSYFKHVEMTSKENYDYQLNEQKHTMMENYYQRIDSYQKEVLRLKHDMKNQLLVLRGHMDKAELPQMESLLDSMLQNTIATEHYHYTNDKTINVLISQKCLQAQKATINCQFDIQMPSSNLFESNDLIVLVSNILDNAIEAASYCDSHNRWLTFQMILQQQCLAIYCENSIDGKHKSLKTRKKESRNHGIGMSSIQRVVQKYDGELDYSWGENTFQIEMHLFEDRL